MKKEKTTKEILNRDESFIIRFAKALAEAISSDKLKIRFTKQSYSLGLTDELIEKLEKEFDVKEEELRQLVSSAISVVATCTHCSKMAKKAEETHGTKVEVLLKQFPKELFEEVKLRAHAGGVFFEDLEWNLLTLNKSSDNIHPISERVSFAEITIAYTPDVEIQGSYKALSLKLSKRSLTKLIESLSDLNEKLGEQ